MAVTILEALYNAQINLVDNRHIPFAFEIGKEQLNNAIVLLEKEYSVNTQLEPLIEKYGSVENVPAPRETA